MQLIGSLAVFHAAEINQLHGGPQLLGQRGHRLTNPFASLALLQAAFRLALAAGQHFHERTHIVVLHAVGPIQAHQPMPTAMHVKRRQSIKVHVLLALTYPIIGNWLYAKACNSSTLSKYKA